MTQSQAAEAAGSEDPVEALRQTAEKLPRPLRDRILAQGDAAVAGLVRVLGDDELGIEESPAGGWPPIHAVDLLVELRAEASIGPMLAILRNGEPDEILYNRIAVRLPSLGAVVLEPVLSELSRPLDADHAGTLCSILSELGVRDQRAWSELARYFDEEPILGAGALARYGDERALALLEREIRAFASEPDDLPSRFDLGELTAAYEQIAGVLPDELLELVDLLAEQGTMLDRLAMAPLLAARTKLGRNDPCPCGRGRKYKRCCIAGAAKA